MPLDDALGELNSRLKAGGHRCTIEQRKASFVIRATLVDRSDPSTKRRQRISLGLQATFATLADAEEKAHQLSRQIRTNSFTWEQWDEPEGPVAITVADFAQAAQRLHASK